MDLRLIFSLLITLTLTLGVSSAEALTLTPEEIETRKEMKKNFKKKMTIPKDFGPEFLKTVPPAVPDEPVADAPVVPQIHTELVLPVIPSENSPGN